MGQIGDLIADAATVGLRYARRLLETVPPERFARVASPGGQPVHSNHPAFNVGHLTLYPVKVVELLGADKAAASPPAHYEALFSKDAQCADDADGTLYPPKQELLEVFQRTYDAALAALRACDDQQLLAANPIDSPMKKVCPTLGSMLAFYMTGHVTSHLGQISTWRRMEGMPAA
jgi:hypothetical protein